MGLKKVCRDVVAVKLAMTVVTITAVLVTNPSGRACLSRVVVRGGRPVVTAHGDAEKLMTMVDIVVGNLHSINTHMNFLRNHFLLNTHRQVTMVQNDNPFPHNYRPF